MHFIDTHIVSACVVKVFREMCVFSSDGDNCLHENRSTCKEVQLCPGVGSGKRGAMRTRGSGTSPVLLQGEQGRGGAEAPALSATHPAPRSPRTLPLHTARTQSPAGPVCSRKARQRRRSWSHSLTAPPSLDLRKEPPRREAALTVGAHGRS